jgi:hypothetical protein
MSILQSNFIISNSDKSVYCTPYYIDRVDPDVDATIEPRYLELQ